MSETDDSTATQLGATPLDSIFERATQAPGFWSSTFKRQLPVRPLSVRTAFWVKAAAAISCSFDSASAAAATAGAWPS
jgi:hypothetical protein